MIIANTNKYSNKNDSSFFVESFVHDSWKHIFYDSNEFGFGSDYIEICKINEYFKLEEINVNL